MGLGKPQLCAKFEVAGFSHCRDIKGDPKVLGAFLAQGDNQFFFRVEVCDRPWKTPAVCQMCSSWLHISLKDDKFAFELLVEH